MENGVRGVRQPGKRYELKLINALFEDLKLDWGIRTDAELADWIGCQRPTVSKIRSGLVPFGDIYILAIHEVFDMPIHEIKERLNAA